MLIRVLITSIAITILVGCRASSNEPANRQGAATNNRELSATSDAELVDKVEIFATDVGDQGEAAWKQLEAYPRQELIHRLMLIRDDPSQDDFIKTNIAFLLCHLDQDYQGNREIIVAAFNQSPDTAELYEAQLDRLIKRGDKGLLQVLFAIVPESDGALSEGLGDTFASEITTDTEEFLSQLRTQPRTLRLQVSEFISESSSDQDKNEIMALLRAIPETSQLAGLAKEIELDLSQVKSD